MRRLGSSAFCRIREVSRSQNIASAGNTAYSCSRSIVTNKIPRMSTELKYVEASELAEILKTDGDSVAILDVRNLEEFNGGHIKGAFNHPSENWTDASFVESVADKVVADGHPKKIVMHCVHSQKRGPTCARILQTRLDELAASGTDASALPTVYVLKNGFAHFDEEFKEDKDLVNR